MTVKGKKLKKVKSILNNCPTLKTATTKPTQIFTRNKTFQSSKFLKVDTATTRIKNQNMSSNTPSILSQLLQKLLVKEDP